MCGIAGILTPDYEQDRLRKETSDAVATLHHRGPDDSGIWLSGDGVALGHARLSILDLSDFGHQPMVSTNQRYVIVFNGEIYNFADLRASLVQLGHSFSGTGDTEVILAAVMEWGSKAFDRMIGMYAIALWDIELKRLELIRDRIGVKPLYFGWNGRTLCFGSELKALRAFRHWSAEIDLRSLGEFLQYGYISGDRTIYMGVYKLKPGHRLVLSRDGDPVIEPYWSALDALGNHHQGTDTEIEAEFESLLIDSFRYRMVSDVPVGVYLSGGIDSSLVTSVLAKHHGPGIRTFTIGFNEDSHDESQWATKVAAHCGTTHTGYMLGIDEALEIARDWGSLFDEPFADPSGIPTLLVSRLSRREVKVVLSADGGDELFSGYEVYASVLRRLRQLEHIPRLLGRSLSAGISLLPPRVAAAGRGDLIRSALGPSLRKIHRFGSMLRNPTTGQIRELYTPYWQPDEVNLLIGAYESPRATADSYPGEPALKLSLLDLHNYLPEDVLAKVDRLTMAVGLEGREPLLDHRLAEFAFSLPERLRRGELGSKHLLKRILYRYVPRELVDRPKQGFGIPLVRWLQQDMKELVHDYLSTARLHAAGIMDSPTVTRAVEQFYAGDITLAQPLWSLLTFEMWHEKWGRLGTRP